MKEKQLGGRNLSKMKAKQSRNKKYTYETEADGGVGGGREGKRHMKPELTGISFEKATFRLARALSPSIPVPPPSPPPEP